MSLCVEVSYMVRLRHMPDGKGKKHLKCHTLAFHLRMRK